MTYHGVLKGVVFGCFFFVVCVQRLILFCPWFVLGTSVVVFFDPSEKHAIELFACLVFMIIGGRLNEEFITPFVNDFRGHFNLP